MEEKEKRQFIAEENALKRKIKSNRRSRIFAIFVLVIVWASVIMDVIAMIKLGNDTTLKYIRLQNSLHFDCLWAFIYTLWCTYSIPKGAELCLEEMDSFLKKWSSVEFDEEKD